MKTDRSPTKTPKTESEQLITLINEFLQVQVDTKGLLANPSMIAHYRKLLEDNLPPHDSEAAEYQWRTELKEVGKYQWREELKLIEEEINESEYIEKAAHISTIHLVLKSIWGDLKEKLSALYSIPKSMVVERHLRGLSVLNELDEKWRNKLTGDFVTIFKSLEEPKLSGKVYKGNKTIETDLVDCYNARGVFKDFISLLRYIELGDLRKCKNEDCKKWFMWNSKLKKEKVYCDHLCGARDNSRKKRKVDSKEHNESMKEDRTKQKKVGRA